MFRVRNFTGRDPFVEKGLKRGENGGASRYEEISSVSGLGKGLGEEFDCKCIEQPEYWDEVTRNGIPEHPPEAEDR